MVTDQEIIGRSMRAAERAKQSESAPPKREKLIFTGEDAKRIEGILSAGISFDDLLAGISSCVDFRRKDAMTRGSRMKHWLSFSNREPRDGQDRFYDNLSTALSDGKIGLCEASTGSGKTAAILAAGADVIRSKKKRILIATPAVALVRDFALEHSRLGDDAPPLRIFLGMGEFVSETELLAFLECWQGFDTQAAAIRKWLKNGAPSLEQGVSQRFLKHSLRLVSNDLPLEEVLLGEETSSEDGGMQAYRAQFDKEHFAENAEEILLCSHAMLAVDLRMRLAVAGRSGNIDEVRAKLNEAWDQVKHHKKEKLDANPAIEKAMQAQKDWDNSVIESSAGLGKIPDYSFLIVDEAHLLEQSFSNSLSSYVAIHQFMRHAKELANKGLFLKSSVNDIETAYRSLCSVAQEQGTDNINISSMNGDITSPLKALAMTATQGLSKISKKRAESLPAELKQKIRAFKGDVACINQAVNSFKGNIAYLNLSPRLAYPRLFVGRASVDQYLRFLWSSCDGAACVSATLYLPKDDGVSSWYMQHILAIPDARKMDFQPVIPRWIMETVSSLSMPSCTVVNGRIPLRPPSRSDKLNEQQKEVSDSVWCGEVATKLREIYDSAAGGCLVLLTSYAYVSKIREILQDFPHIADNLVFAQQGDSATKDKPRQPSITIDEQRRKFLSLAFEGKKPIWLALGNAWTGINLSGGDPMKDFCGKEIPAEMDNVLTDLVIPRLPFGINKSVTHTHRINHQKNIPWERINTILLLRQGIGRLVRRFGVPKNRRIHILDARLCNGILAGMWKQVERAIGFIK